MVQAGTEHLMLGRGAVTRPDLVARVDCGSDDGMLSAATLSWEAMVTHQIRFLEGQAKTEVILVGRYKQWLAMLIKGYSEAKVLWDSIKREKNKAAIISALQASVRQ